MQKVSSKWRANQRQNLVDENFVEISLEMSDPDAIADVTDNGAVWFSRTSQVSDGLDKEFVPYATMEQNLWVLDGVSRSLPNSYEELGDTGYVSDVICDEDAIFQVTPIVEANFDEVHEKLIPGVTIAWSTTHEEYAVDFIVTAYNYDEIVARLHVENNQGTISIVGVDIQSYNKISIEINEWSLPVRRARIEEIFIGVRHVYTKKDIGSFTQKMVSSPLSSSLPNYSLSYKLDNTRSEYDFSNPTGLAGYLLERQRIKIRYGYKFNGVTEWIPGGVYYLSEWTLPQNGISVTFKARDILEFMDEIFIKGLLAPDGVSLYDLAEQVLMELDLPLNPDGNVNWIIDETLKDIYTSAPLPMVSHAECLQYIANAGCCVMFFDRSGRFRMEPPSIITSFAGYADAADSGSAWFSKTVQIVDGIDKDIAPYATLETNLWVLDASMDLLPGNYEELGDTGYVSDVLCDENAVFQSPPTVTLNFSRIHRNLVTDITITWGETFEEYATNFIITAYVNDEILSRLHFTDNTDTTSVLEVNFQGYNKISIQINEWSLPNRRARIENIPVRPDYEISLFNSFSLSDITLSKPLRGVQAKAYKYFPEENETELFNGVIPVLGVQTVTITYSQASVDVSATAENGTIVEAIYYTNSCELTIDGDGDVSIILLGIPLKTSETLAFLPHLQDGEIQTVENPLITSVNRARAVAQWTLEYLSNRTVISSNWRADPRMDVLDIIMNQNKYDTQPVRMTSVEYKYNGAFRGTGEGRALLG